MRFLLAMMMGIGLSLAGHAQAPSEWTMIYVMAYDNDLDRFHDAIQGDLARIPSNPNLNIVLIADTRSDSMVRYQSFSKEGEYIQALCPTTVPTEEWLRMGLAEVIKQNPAQHYALSFLNHGGSPDEIGLDDREKPYWLRVDRLAAALESFTETSGQPLDLLYLQVCAKGNLETLYEFNEVAKYTLFSQHILFAPNHYYTEAMKWLGQHPESTGLQLAESIAKYERKDMYLSLTCIDNQAWSKVLPLLFNIDGKSARRTYYPALLHTTEYKKQKYWDLASYLDALNGRQSRQRDKIPALRKVLNEELISFHQINPEYFISLQSFCGVSLIGGNLKLQQEQYAFLRYFQAQAAYR